MANIAFDLKCPVCGKKAAEMLLEPDSTVTVLTNLGEEHDECDVSQKGWVDTLARGVDELRRTAHDYDQATNEGMPCADEH